MRFKNILILVLLVVGAIGWSWGAQQYYEKRRAFEMIERIMREHPEMFTPVKE